MDDNQRLHLQKMIAVNNVEDQTGINTRAKAQSYIKRECKQFSHVEGEAHG